MNDEYQTRQFHEVTHYNSLVFGSQNKPIAIALYEPDKKEIRFFKKTEDVKVTEFKL